LWVGTTANGLKFIPTGSDTAQSITNGLPPKSLIYALYLDQNDTLWIGTVGGGLYCLRNGKMTGFMSSEGLSTPTVLQIVEDDNHYLWLGCRRGIFRVSKAELLDYADGKTTLIHSRSFGLNDGMLNEECTGGYSPAGLKTKDGLICISTVEGLVFIDPSKVSDEAPPPKVMLEEAIVKTVEQDFASDGAAAGDPVSGLPSQPKLALTPDRRDIEIHYTAIGFSAPEKIGFRYKLEPLDTEWKEVGPLRTATYTHLPPGIFTFHVQACNADGVWNGQDTTLAITAQPYFWETPWFHTLVVLGVAALVAGISGTVLRNRYKMRLARLQAQNAVERERLRISKDMHDHVGSVLTQVSQLTDMGVNETENESLVKKRFERIGNRARVAVQSLDEIVWATNPKNDNLASFAEYISRFSDEFFEYTNIRCWQEMPANVPALPLRADIRHNVFLALREALNNSVKHSHCTEVWLRMKIDQENVTVQFEDNGSGFTPGPSAPGADGLGNMESRLTECGGRVQSVSAPGKGTSTTFIFPIKH
jgi:signal transduction histidine kinase